MLKFIGDAICSRSFSLARTPRLSVPGRSKPPNGAQAALAEENQRRDAGGAPRIEYGLPLHIGDVMYGNIGSDSRLDFTVIGPAVNLTARIELMCRPASFCCHRTL